MRLCFLAPANSIHTRRWVEYMANRGHRVDIITFHRGDKIPKVKVHYLPSPAKLIYPFFLSKIRFLIKIINPDILHAHYASSYGLLGACSGFHPFVLSVWGWDVMNFPENSFLHKLLVKYTLKKADRITATSHILKSTVVSLAPMQGKISIIPFGADLVSFRPQGKRKENKTVTIGTVKALRNKYGIEFLIQAFALVKKKFKNVDLIIVGKGPLRESLEQLSIKLGCAEKTHFIGEISYSQVPEYLGKMHVFVVPSIDESESFGVAAVEASACELPVIASNVGGLPEVVIDKKTGLLVDPRNPQALAEAIIRLIENPGLRREYGRRGREFVMENYDWQENAKRMENLYEEVLSHN